MITTDAIEEHAMRAGRTTEQVRAVCADLLVGLGISPPFDAWQLCRRLGDARGRRIRTQGADLGGVTVIGHLLALPAQDRILYDDRAPRSQQQHVIYHEVMHLVLGHLDEQTPSLTCGSLLTPDADVDAGQAEGDEPADLLAGDPDRDDPGVGGPRHLDVHEVEAETGATVLSRLAALRQRPDEYVASQPGWTGERGIAAALGLVAPRWRSR